MIQSFRSAFIIVCDMLTPLFTHTFQTDDASCELPAHIAFILVLALQLLGNDASPASLAKKDQLVQLQSTPQFAGMRQQFLQCRHVVS